MAELKQFILELTNACNSRCVFCPNRLSKRDVTHLDLNILDKLLNEIKTIDILMDPVKGIPFGLCGIGEPLMHPEFPAICEMIRDSGVPSAVGSNGHLVGKHIDSLVALDAREAVFSIDSVTPETHARMRPNLDYYRVVEGIKEFVSRVKAKDTTPDRLFIQSIVCEINIHEVPSFVEKWLREIEGMDCAKIFVKTICPWPYHEANTLWPSPPHGLPKELEEHPQVQVAPYPPPETYRQSCGLFDGFAQVLSDGSYVPCCMPTQDYWGIGNVRNMTLLECFHSEVMEKLRRMKKEEIVFCKDCV